MSIRDETASDVEAVFCVNDLAFADGGNVARLVNALRDHGKVIFSLVAEEDSQVVGHIMFTTTSLEPPSAHGVSLQLSPLAVLPEFQGRGIGSALAHEGIERCRTLGAACVFVEGNPRYYSRFGFVPAVQRGVTLKDHADSPRILAAFQVIELKDGALAGGPRVARYEDEFEEFDAI